MWDPKAKLTKDGGNLMDRWIVAANQNLLQFFHKEMAAYRLYTVVPRLLRFLEELTNWYVRLNRTRLKGDQGPAEQEVALHTLFDVLLNTCTMMSCFTPFMAEILYQNLKNGIAEDSPLKAESIHYL